MAKHLLIVWILFPLLLSAQLIQTNWHEAEQNPFCPEGTFPGNRSVILAELLNYWQHPNCGWGQVSYYNVWTGQIETEFEIPIEYGTTDWHRQLLIYLAGCSAKHQFSPYFQNSYCGIYDIDTMNTALHVNWGYKYGTVYDGNDGIAPAIADIQNNMPVILESYPAFGCPRYFILDGYSDGLFHVHAGCGGLFNGWMPIDSIYALGVWYGVEYRVLTGIMPDSMSVSGYVYYDQTINPLQSWINFSQNVCCIQADQNGYFSTCIPKGWYCTTTATLLSWGHVNSVDALVILKTFVGTYNLEGLKEQAADVSQDWVINATDALMCSQRFVGLITWPHEWVFAEKCFHCDTTFILYGRCYGDVN